MINILAKNIKNAGFTLVEVLVVLFIFFTIVTLPLGFLWGIGRSDNLRLATREVISKLNHAHANTISGKSVDGQQTSSYGVFFNSSYYVLFSGTSYDPNDSNNERTDLPTGITFSSIQIPGDIIVFDKVTGKIINFDAGQNSITLLDDKTQATRRLTISQIGSISYE